MPDSQHRHLKGTHEKDVLVLTILETQLQDEHVADELLDEALSLLTQTTATKVVVDFQRLKYMSSVAFRPFLSIRRQLQDSGGRMILCGLTSVVGDVFYTTKLVNRTGTFDAPFEMAPDVKAAVARLNASQASISLPPSKPQES